MRNLKIQMTKKRSNKWFVEQNVSEIKQVTRVMRIEDDNENRKHTENQRSSKLINEIVPTTTTDVAAIAVVVRQ